PDWAASDHGSTGYSGPGRQARWSWTSSPSLLATGSDGYAALINHGEISPDFDNRGTLLATTDDDKTLPHPRSGRARRCERRPLRGRRRRPARRTRLSAGLQRQLDA